MAADRPAPETYQRLVSAAAAHLDIPAGEVSLLRVEQRTWPDTALGCPEPGWQYAQVLTPGYLVVARAADGRELTLHADEHGRTVVCPGG